MNAYEMYSIGDTFENSNGTKYVVLGLSEDRDKALLCTLSKPTLYIGAKGLEMHHWHFGHYFMENLMTALEWFAMTTEEEYVKEEALKNKGKHKRLFRMVYDVTDTKSYCSDNYEKELFVFAYSYEEAEEAIFNHYFDTDWRVINLCGEQVGWLDSTEDDNEEVNE